LEIGL
jgi:hypothetical protein